MAMKKQVVYLTLVATGAVPGVFAEEGIQLGDSTLLPFITTAVTHDDNVFSDSTDKNDMYFEYTLGARWIRETDTTDIQSGLWFADRKYDDYDEKDGTRWGIGALGKTMTDKSYFSGMFDFRQVEDYDDAPALGKVPKGFEGTVDKGFDRTQSDEKRNLYDIALGMGQDISDAVGLSLGYSFYKVDYDDNIDGWHENVIGGEADYAVTDKTDVFFNLQYGMQDGDGAPDGADFVTTRGGVSYAMTDKTELRLGMGVTQYSTDDDDYDEFSYEASGYWQATEKVNAFVSGRNEVQPTGTGNDVQLSNRLSAGVRYQATDAFSVVTSGSLIYDEELDGDKDESKEQIGTILANYDMNNGLRLYAKAEFTNSNNDGSDDYERFRGTIGAGYNF